MTTTNDNDDIEKLESRVDELTKALDEAVEDAATANQAELSALQAQVTELTEKLAKAEEDAAEATLKAAMTQDEKDHCSDMEPDERSAFMAKPVEDRKKAMKKRLDDDEIIKVEGQEIRKSVIGEAQFAIIKAQDARLRKADEDIAKERDARELADLRKRADDEFPHVPGDVNERAAMLKVISKMDKGLQKSFEAVFTQSEKLSKGAFETVGTSAGEDISKRRKSANGPTDFEKKVDEIHKSVKGITRSEAMTKARTDYPEEFAAYQNSNKSAN